MSNKSLQFARSIVACKLKENVARITGPLIVVNKCNKLKS